MNIQKTKRQRILCIGGIVRDIFVRPASSSIISIKQANHAEKFLGFTYGGKIVAEDLQFARGGGGCNVSVSFARMDMESVLVGAVGADEIGDDLLHDLQSEQNLILDHVQKLPKAKTGLSVIINSYDGERSILAYRGGNEEVDLSRKHLDKLPSAPWVYLTSLSGKSNAQLATIATWIKDTGKMLAFNPGSSQLALGKKALQPLLFVTSVLMMNIEEAESLVGVEQIVYTTKKQHGRVVGVKKDNTQILLKKLFALGPKIVVLTNGNKGSIAYDGTHTYTFGTYPQHVVDTLGAGDAFGSGFIAGLLHKKDNISYALALGTTNATSVVSSYGAQQGLLTKEKATMFISKHPGVKAVKHRTM